MKQYEPTLPLEDAGVGEAAVRARGEQGEALVLALQAVAARGDVGAGGGMDDDGAAK